MAWPARPAFDGPDTPGRSLAGPVALGIALGLLSGSLALLGGTNLFLKAGAIGSIIYAVGGVILMLALPRWRTGLFLMLWLGAPPFVDYELAWIATAGFRAPGVSGLRETIGFPIASLLDLSLLLGLTLFLSHQSRATAAPARARQERAPMPLWLGLGVAFFTLLAALASLQAAQRFPEYSATALAGLTASLRVFLAVPCAVALAPRGFGRRETTLGLLAGFWLFLLESLYVTYLKFGSIRLGWVEMTGVIPGPGATGSLLVLLIPILGALVFGPGGKWLRRALAAAAAAGTAYALLTYSRTVYAGLLAAATVFLVAMLARRRRGVGRPLARFSLVVVALVLAGTLVGAVALASDYHASKLVGYGLGLDAGWNLGSRMYFWLQGLDLLRDNPLLGLGPQMWGVVTTRMGITPHNAYLQFAVENGLPAFLAWAGVIGFALFAGCRAVFAKRTDLEPFVIGAVSGLAGFLTTQFFDSALFNYRTSVIFWTVLVLLVAAARAPAVREPAVKEPAVKKP